MSLAGITMLCGLAEITRLFCKPDSSLPTGQREAQLKRCVDTTLTVSSASCVISCLIAGGLFFVSPVAGMAACVGMILMSSCLICCTHLTGQKALAEYKPNQ